MEDRRQEGGADRRLTTTAVRSEVAEVGEVMQVREPSGHVTSSHLRMRKEDISDVPRKVPRFQYVDFPSLHQCIQQLSVPPLDGWLASCQLARASAHGPASPKERVPKFKYVDYPSLHHCIQQLSVPPLESWSSGLLRAGGGDARGGVQGDSATDRRASCRSGPGPAVKTERSTAFPFPSVAVIQQRRADPIPTGRTADHSPGPCPAQPAPGENRSSIREDPAQMLRGSGSETASREVDGTGTGTVGRGGRGDDRPTVISVVRTDRDARHRRPQGTLDPHGPAEPARLSQKNVAESACPLCQQTFSDPEELCLHQYSHRDKRPH